MKRMKFLYYIVLLVISVALGVLIVLPELIPSLELIQIIILVVLYLANIVFAYVIVIRFRNFLRKKLSEVKTTLFTGFAAFVVVVVVFFAFIFTSLGIGQGFMGGHLYKEINYPKHKVTLYLYDDSFLDPLTTIKIKHKIFPIMKNIAFIENCHPADLSIWRHDDIVEFSFLPIAVRINLLTRNARKTYNNKELEIEAGSR